MKCLCVGDVHIKVSNVPETEQMTEKLVQLAKEIQPDFIVLLGDVLDRHSTIHVHCLMRCETLILELSKIARTFVLVGNHDRPNNSNFLTDEHPFNAMKLWENVDIIDFPKDVRIQDHRFVFVPYVPPGRFAEALEKLEYPYSGTTCFFAHQEFRNAKMGAIVSKEGDKWEENLPLVVSGHIHDYDLLQPNIVYTGTPLMHAFGDKSDKTVSIFTFQNENWEQERKDLGLIKKVTVYITPDKLSDYEPPEDKLVRLVVKGNEASIKSVLKLNKVQELKKKGVKVVFKTVQTNETSDKTVIPRMSYRDRLFKEIHSDSYMLKWFRKIF